MGQLDYLANLNVRHPVAHTWNQMLRELAKRLPKQIIASENTGRFIHPFYTSAVPWNDMPKEAAYDPARAWRVDVVSGCVNDVVVTVPYVAQGDVRGWTMPTQYPFAPAGPLKAVDRPLYDKSDPIPFLVMESPSEDGTDMKNFVPIADGVRPPFFKTGEMWEKSLFQTSVMVTADPKTVIAFNPSLPLALRRYRVFIGKPQPPSVTNVKEIARLYLVRDSTNKPELDEVFVCQKIFWDLQTMIVQAGKDLFATAEIVRNIGVDPVTNAYGSIAADSLVEMALPLSYTAWWTA